MIAQPVCSIIPKMLDLNHPRLMDGCVHGFQLYSKVIAQPFCRAIPIFTGFIADILRTHVGRGRVRLAQEILHISFPSLHDLPQYYSAINVKLRIATHLSTERQ